MSKNGYDNSIIGFFTLNDEDFLLVSDTEYIAVINPSNFLWLILIFCLLIIIISYGTYLLYKEVKKREKEVDANPELSIGMNENNNNIDNIIQ